MGDMGDFWRDVAAARKRQQESRMPLTLKQVELLRGVPSFQIEAHNGGQHLACTFRNRTVDFFPSTGKWIQRGTKRRSGFGVPSMANLFGLHWAELVKGAAAAEEQSHGSE